MLSKNHNGNSSIRRFAVLFLLQISFFAKAHKYFEDRNITHIVILFSCHLEKKKKKKMKEDFLRISEGVIHLNIYDCPMT